MLRDALLENLHRANLNPLEEASAYQQLLADFGITQDELAAHRPIASADHQHPAPPQAAGAVQKRVAAGVLSAGHARAILSRATPTRWRSSRTRSSTKTSRCAPPRRPLASHRSRRPKANPGRRQGQLDEIAERLGDRLNTRVKVTLVPSKARS